MVDFEYYIAANYYMSSLSQALLMGALVSTSAFSRSTGPLWGQETVIKQLSLYLKQNSFLPLF